MELCQIACVSLKSWDWYSNTALYSSFQKVIHNVIIEKHQVLVWFLIVVMI